jgi:hypothetical protein
MLDWLKAIAAGAVGIGGLVVALVSPNSTLPAVDVRTTSADCAVATIPVTEARATGRTIVITAEMDTPNPCFRVTGSVEVLGTRIVGSLAVVSTNSACIQCLGRVVGEVTISNLQPGVYTLQIDTPGGEFIRTVEVL